MTEPTQHPPGSTLAAVQLWLTTASELSTVIVFGSVAAGTARFESDLDIAVQAQRALTTPQRLQYIAQLAEATGRSIDLIDLRTVGEPLRGEIVRHGLRLRGSDADYADLVLRNLYDKADFMPYINRLHAERLASWITPSSTEN